MESSTVPARPIWPPTRPPSPIGFGDRLERRPRRRLYRAAEDPVDADVLAGDVSGFGELATRLSLLIDGHSIVP